LQARKGVKQEIRVVRSHAPTGRHGLQPPVDLPRLTPGGTNKFLNFSGRNDVSRIGPFAQD
jgi:hypothetical protein